MRRALLEMTQGMESEAQIKELVADFSSTPSLPKSWREGSKWLCKSVQGAVVFHEGDGFHRRGRRLMSALQYNLILRLPLSFKSRVADQDNLQLFHHLREEGPRLSVQLLKQRDFCADPPEELEELRLRAVKELVMNLLCEYDLYHDGVQTRVLEQLYQDDPDIGTNARFPVFPLFIEVATAPGLPSPSTWNTSFLKLLASGDVPPFDGGQSSWHLCGIYPLELTEVPVEKPTQKALAMKKTSLGDVAPGERYILAEVQALGMGLSQGNCLEFDWDREFRREFVREFGLRPEEAVALLRLNTPDFGTLLKGGKSIQSDAIEVAHRQFLQSPVRVGKEGNGAIRDVSQKGAFSVFYRNLHHACEARRPQPVKSELVLRILVDKATAVQFAELVPAGELFSPTLLRATQVEGLSPLYGKPSELQVSSSLLKRHPDIGQWCQSRGIAVVAPASGAQNALTIQREWRHWLSELVSLRVWADNAEGLVLGSSVCGRHPQTLEPLDPSMPLHVANAWVQRRAWAEGDLATFAKEARNTSESALLSGCSLRIKVVDRFEMFKSRI